MARVVYESCGGEFSPARFLGNKMIDPARRKKIILRANKLYKQLGASDQIAKSEDFWTEFRDAKIL